MNQPSRFVQSLSKTAPKTARGQKTWVKLLEAAEQEFGEKGYYEAAITGITQRAGVAMGTFYVHFQSKEEIFRALVQHMGTLTRSWVSNEVSGSSSRIEAEIKGIKAFINFVRQHKNLYYIVNEAQFVAPDAYKEYYSSFEEAYRRRLDEAVEAGEIEPGNNNIRSWTLIGANVFLGMRFGLWDDDFSVEEIGQEFENLITQGLLKK